MLVYLFVCLFVYLITKAEALAIIKRMGLGCLCLCVVRISPAQPFTDLERMDIRIV